MSAPAADPARRARRSRACVLALVAAVLIAAAVAATFAPASQAGLLNFDDDQNLALNHGFRGTGPAQLRWMLTTAWMGHYQPLTWLSFALDERAWGFTAPDYPEAGRFHRTSVLLHALTALLVFALARQVLLTGARGRARELAGGLAGSAAAAAAALLFALHPLRVESVVWLTERRDVLSAPFLLLACLAWLRYAQRAPAPTTGARASRGVAAASAGSAVLALASLRMPVTGALGLAQGGAVGLALAGMLLLLAAWLAARGDARRVLWYCATLLLLLLSLLAKAWGIVLPALLLLLDAWPLRRAHHGPRAWVALLVEKLPLVALAVVFARLAAWAQWTQGGTLKSLAEHGVGERAAQALYGLAYYPLRTLAPSDLSPIYELPERLSLLELRFSLAALAVGVIGVTCFWLRRKLPAWPAAWAAFALIVAPVLGLAQSGPQLVADRYSYLATLPFALLAGGGLLALHARAPRAAAAAWIVAVLAVVGLAAQTRRLTAIWQGSESLWTHAIALQPRSTTAALCLGQVLEARAKASPAAERAELLERAATLYLQGHARRPDARFLSNLAGIEAARAQADPARRGEHLERAVQLAREALQLAAERRALTPEYRLNLGTYLYQSGQVEPGLEHLRWFVQARPDDPRGRFNLAVALQRLDRPREALPHAEHLVARAPRHADGWALLGQLREALAEPAAARAAYAQALAIAPDHPLARARAAALAP